MKKNELLKWTLSNAFGLGIAFVVSLQTLMILEYGPDTDRYWKFGQPLDYASLSTYLYYLISFIVGGAVFGWAQSLVLKTKNIKPLSWILATVIGFTLIILIDWPLIYTENLGIIPGPVEPLIFTVGGCAFAGMIQILLLKRLNINNKKWFLMWIIGLIVGVLVSALFFMFFADMIGLNWPLEVFFSGFIIAGVASLISGKTLFSVLSKP